MDPPLGRGDQRFLGSRSGTTSQNSPAAVRSSGRVQRVPRRTRLFGSTQKRTTSRMAALTNTWPSTRNLPLKLIDLRCGRRLRASTSCAHLRNRTPASRLPEIPDSLRRRPGRRPSQSGLRRILARSPSRRTIVPASPAINSGMMPSSESCSMTKRAPYWREAFLRLPTATSIGMTTNWSCVEQSKRPHRLKGNGTNLPRQSLEDATAQLTQYGADATARLELYRLNRAKQLAADTQQVVSLAEEIFTGLRDHPSVVQEVQKFSRRNEARSARDSRASTRPSRRL